ncbi:DinB family protein [Streptomyces morookaense]|uniref:DinB family protein n=1 Tax=Streptomyces TaxID=1883 RepID=UPI001D129B21|nr:DinB family protein [Streptomyces sp. ET3-23]MCC2276148.1 DinB family protein [Streptomyces sp. ET3-23]
MTTPERTYPPYIADERSSLESWLDFHRATLAAKCAGLDDGQLREASVPPSMMTLLGLVRHMADVERAWFRRVFAGDTTAEPLFYTDEDPDADFRVSEKDTWDEADAAWQAEIAAAREVVRGHSLDDVSTGRRHRDGAQVDLRWIYVHMIEEYARHNGHADFLRERIDGATGA